MVSERPLLARGLLAFASVSRDTDRIPRDGDGKLTGDEIRGRLRERLEQVDTDGDGEVTQDEFVGGMRRLFGRGGGGGRERGPDKPKRPQRPALQE